MGDDLKTDIALNFAEDGSIDMHMDGGGECVSGKDNLTQALKLKLLMYRGELSGLGHPNHGTVIRDFLGEPLTRANIELLRRYVKKALVSDNRVESVDSIVVKARRNIPGAVDVNAIVTAIEGSKIDVDITIGNL